MKGSLFHLKCHLDALFPLTQIELVIIKLTEVQQVLYRYCMRWSFHSPVKCSHPRRGRYWIFQQDLATGKYIVLCPTACPTKSLSQAATRRGASYPADGWLQKVPVGKPEWHWSSAIVLLLQNCVLCHQMGHLDGLSQASGNLGEESNVWDR